MDRDGLRTDVLEELLRTESVDLIYVNPTFHNPTGSTLSSDRRRRLAALAEESRALLVEGEVFVDLSFEETPPIASVASLAEEASVVTVGSMSGLFWSGLRIGWLRGPKNLISRLGRTKATADLGTPLIDQLVSSKLLDHVDDARVARRADLRAGLQTVTALLRETLPEWSWHEPSGGPALWLRLHDADAGEFAQVAAREGVLILPGPVFSLEEKGTDRLRLPFVLSESGLTIGVQRLAQEAGMGAIPRARSARRPTITV